MAVSFVASDDIYHGVARAVRYGIMFIGIVFLATLIFEAVSGRKAHPAQYILVGLAQCVFYLLLLSLTEIIGFTPAFLIAAAATVALLAYYAGASFQSGAVGVRALIGLGRALRRHVRADDAGGLRAAGRLGGRLRGDRRHHDRDAADRLVRPRRAPRRIDRAGQRRAKAIRVA